MEQKELKMIISLLQQVNKSLAKAIELMEFLRDERKKKTDVK